MHLGVLIDPIIKLFDFVVVGHEMKMEFVNELLFEINKVRTQPQQVAKELETYKNKYKGLELTLTIPINNVQSTFSTSTLFGIEGKKKHAKKRIKTTISQHT